MSQLNHSPDPAGVGDAATLMALLWGTKRSSSLRDLLSGWDMLQADVPSRERFESAPAVLVGSELAVVEEPWSLRLTEAGNRLRKSVPGRINMRSIPRFLVGPLGEQRLSCADLSLPPELFDAAVADYFNRSRRSIERGSKKRWWWPDPSQRGS